MKESLTIKTGNFGSLYFTARLSRVNQIVFWLLLVNIVRYIKIYLAVIPTYRNDVVLWNFVYSILYSRLFLAD